MTHLPELGCDELAVIYSAAILADDDVTITVDKISTILKAANVDVEPIWPALYARALSGVNVRQLLTTVAAAAAGLPSGSQSHLGGSSSGAPSAGLAPDTAKPVDAATLKHAQEVIINGAGGDDDDDDEDLGMSLFDFD